MEATALYLKGLLKERDRLVSALGCRYSLIHLLLDMDTILSNSDSPMATEEEQVDVFPAHEQSPFDQILQQKHQFYISEANRIKREHPERYAGHSLAQRILDMGTVPSTGNQSERLSTASSSAIEMPPPKHSLSQQSVQSRITTKPVSKPEGDLLDYHQIWMKNNIASAVMQIENGQILKGNDTFMK